MFNILESIKKFNQPRSLDGSQDIPFYQNMFDFIHLGQSPLSHLFESTNFPRINLSSEINGSITSLAYLGDNPELIDSELCTSFSKEDTFSAIV